jgi:carbon storage regulator
MLVLSRKSGERIHIGDNITIEVRRVAGNRVTLALDAPRSLRILRGELEKVAHEFGPTQNEADATLAYHVTHQRVPVSNGLTPEMAARDYAI